MVGEPRTHGPDEGSWVYLISPGGDRNRVDVLRDRIVEICEASGWPAISRSNSEMAEDADPGHFFEGMHHAVGHSDCVVAILEAADETLDAELALAFSQRRPIVCLQRGEDTVKTSVLRTRLMSYERGWFVSGGDVDECATQLHALLGDPEFSEAVRRAAGEHASNP
jgi:hypothetical protein